MAFLIKILDRKTILINVLKNFNEMAEKNPNSMNEKFY
jgi:hypothetical protein